jgi:hypothetical protein
MENTQGMYIPTFTVGYVQQKNRFISSEPEDLLLLSPEEYLD